MPQEVHVYKIKKGFSTVPVAITVDVKTIRGKKYGMQLGGFNTKKKAEAWKKHLEDVSPQYRKPGALAVAREDDKGPWAVWYREVT